MNPKTSQRGFTLVEIIVVLVVIGVLAGTMVMFVRPAFQNYLAVGRRAGLTNQADTALRLMTREIRAAVPNSIRLDDTSSCAEFVPTIDGGRFRSAPDTVWDAANSANLSDSLDLGTADTVFDVLTPFSVIPSPGDMIVIGNQNTDDVYTNAPALIANVVTPADTAPERAIFRHRITLQNPVVFPAGYEGGRFVVVPAAGRAVTYQCNLATGELLRHSGYVPGTTPSCPPQATPPTTTTVRNTVATRVTGCQFTYYPNQGATQESGYLEIELRLSDGGETVVLSHGTHVDNIP